MYHLMLPLFISCTITAFCVTSSLISTTKGKNIVKLSATIQTRQLPEKGQWPAPMVHQRKHIHSVCCEDNYFPKGKFKFFNSLFLSVYLVFLNTFDFYCRFICRALFVRRMNEDNCCAVTHLAADILVRSLGLFTRRVYIRTYCVPVATLNQNKRSPLLYLGDAQIIRNVTWRHTGYQIFKNCLCYAVFTFL